MAVSSCPICGTPVPSGVTEPSHECRQCHALLNLTTEALVYQDGGGQDIPSDGKRTLRLRNACRRLALITPHLDAAGKYSLVDIGSGSGEMLEAGLKLLGAAQGFEPNRHLAGYARQRGLPVTEGVFDPDGLSQDGRDRLFCVSHVLEHLDQPVALLSQVAALMGPRDRLWVELPSWEGLSFRRQGYQWKLWYPEHLALWSQRTGIYAAQAAGLRSMAMGRRVFAGEAGGRRLLTLALANLDRAIPALPHVAQGLESFADQFLGDYLWMLLQRP